MVGNIDSTKYVVLDVETNGLSAMRDDLLSISMFKPDTLDEYNRFLPLELNRYIATSNINGIKEKDLKGKQPLTQEEVDSFIEKFELNQRVILTYSNLDERFIRKYFKRHNLKGFDKLSFYNFKHDIISSRFSGGNITKDNLCKLYGIKGVRKVHSGLRDCKLEWELYKAMNGHKLLITGNDVYELSPDYIVPVSYLNNYYNFRYHISDLPKITCYETEVYNLQIQNFVKKFGSNFDGVLLEHEITSMLKPEIVDSYAFLFKNKNMCKYVGRLPSEIYEIDLAFNDDGSFTAANDMDQEIVYELNAASSKLQKALKPLIEFINGHIFNNLEIYSQELVVDKKYKLLSLCDLSSESAVLEIKSYNTPVDRYAWQLYIESQGRDCFILHTERTKMGNIKGFRICKVDFLLNQPTVRKKRDPLDRYPSKKRTSNLGIIVDSEQGEKIRLKCLRCNKCWTTYKHVLNAEEIVCPGCWR